MWRKGLCECKFHSLRHLQWVMLHTCVKAIRWIVDNDESCAVKTALAIEILLRLTAPILMLISVVFDLHLTVSSDCCIASTKMFSDCSIRPTSIFYSDRATPFKLCHTFVMYKNPSLRHCYSQLQIFTVEMQRIF